MGKKEDQRRFDQMMALLQSQINQAKQPSPWETEAGNKYNTTKAFLDKRDYRNLPTGVNIDLLSQAENNRMRKMISGRDTSGQAAAGTMGRIGQSQKMLLDDQAAKDWSGAYEEKIGGLMGQQDDLLNFLQGGHTSRMSQALQGQTSALGLLGQRPKSSSFWGDLLRGVLPGAAQGLIGLI